MTDEFRIPRDCFVVRFTHSLAMTQGILEFLVLEILGSSPRMTKKVKSGDEIRLRNSRILVIASEAKQSLGILNLFLEF